MASAELYEPVWVPTYLVLAWYLEAFSYSIVSTTLQKAHPAVLNSAHSGSGLRGTHMVWGHALKLPSSSAPCHGGPLTSMVRSQLALNLDAMFSFHSRKGVSMNQCGPSPAGCSRPSERWAARSTISARFLVTPKRPNCGPGKKPEGSYGAAENIDERGPEPCTAHAPARPRMHSSSAAVVLR